MWRRAKRMFLSNTRQWVLYVCALIVFLCHVAVHYGGGSASAGGSSAAVKRGENGQFAAVNLPPLTRHLEGPAMDSEPRNDNAALGGSHQSKASGFASNETKLSLTGKVTRPAVTPRYQYNCSSIQHITIKRKLGHGVSKQVYLGLDDGKKVAVKMVTRNVLDVTSCVKKREREGTYKPEDRSKCFSFPNMKLMKEILLLEQLQHPNLMKMLGYCVRSEETESTSLEEHGIVAIYEYALRFYTSTLLSWPFQLRLKTAIELADLLDYFEHSPLGSLRISDFKDAHFLLKDGRIKLTDMDDVTSLEPSCAPPGAKLDQGDNEGQSRSCDFGLKCIGGICPGQNAKKNLENMHKLFFRELLFDSTSKEVDKHGGAILSDLQVRLDGNSISAREVKSMLYALMNVPYIPGYS